eukprot:593999_1
MAVGSYNHTIFLIGGFAHPQQTTEYNVITETFININETALSQNIYGGGQYWTQQDDIMYIIFFDKDGTNEDSLTIYNMTNRQITDNWMSFPKQVTFYGCLASIEGYLYVTGGIKGVVVNNDLQILDLFTFKWLSDTPNMRHPRYYHACVVHNHYLWVFGGIKTKAYDDSNPDTMSSNERISIANIEQSVWDDKIQSLTINLAALRAIGSQDIIFVIGGWSVDYYQILHLIDASTGAVTLAENELAIPLPNAWCAPIIYNNILYLFGGFRSTGDNYWAFYPIWTFDPTITPTEYPTIGPSNAPSQYPTMKPTYEPSQYPTIEPTNVPSQYPSQYPSVEPSNSPSQFITIEPTNVPSQYPTFSTGIMTNDPTASSSKISSVIPTTNPTVHPIASKRDTKAPTHHLTVIPSLDTTIANITQFMISITFNDCLQNCSVTKDEINNILIAYIGDSVILDTDIVDNEITVIVSIVATELNELDKDVITGGIEKDLKVKYGDVDVNMDDNENDDESEHIVKREDDPTVLVVVLVMLCAICGIIMSCIYCCMEKQKANIKQLVEVDVVPDEEDEVDILNEMQPNEAIDTMKRTLTEEAEKSDEDDIEKLYDHEGIQRVEGNTCTKETPLTSGTAQSVPQRTNDIEFTAMDLMRNVDEANVDQEGLRNSVIVPN